jgi:hypothetical protein
MEREKISVTDKEKLLVRIAISSTHHQPIQFSPSPTKRGLTLVYQQRFTLLESVTVVVTQDGNSTVSNAITVLVQQDNNTMVTETFTVADSKRNIHSASSGK